MRQRWLHKRSALAREQSAAIRNDPARREVVVENCLGLLRCQALECAWPDDLSAINGHTVIRSGAVAIAQQATHVADAPRCKMHPNRARARDSTPGDRCPVTQTNSDRADGTAAGQFPHLSSIQRNAVDASSRAVVDHDLTFRRAHRELINVGDGAGQPSTDLHRKGVCR